jgi:[acyl-carrier-protein] S-malonyltransferase
MTAVPAQPLIVLCPGQGAQWPGMGRAWVEASPEARDLFALADRILAGRLPGGATLSDLCFQGPESVLNRTDVSQPAIFVMSMACWKGLLARWGYGNGELPLAAAAGLSLGEYTALCLAGAIPFEQALELVALRGRAMQEAAEASPGGMVALIGADEAQARDLCDRARGSDVLVCANFNAPGQIVLSGSRSACERAAREAQALGLRASPLPVAGAFHSPLMAPAAERLSKALQAAEITVPRCPVLSNVSAMPHEGSPDAIRRRLVEQLTSPVRWSECGAWLATKVAGEHHELAPGRTLAGLMRRLDKSIKVETHDEP